MAYIAPDSNVRILHNVPLDADYLNTKDFASASNQLSFFQSLTKYNLANINYQRANKNSIRVEIRTELLYDCNYIMFQNTAFGNKWFYAFITKVDYINNITSEITYEIDVLQTWQFDYTLNTCFIEREHSATDFVGDNIIPENLPVGEYVFNDYINDAILKFMAIIVAIVDVESSNADGQMYDGVYGGATLFAYPARQEAMNSIDAKISAYIASPESVISIYMCPLYFVDSSMGLWANTNGIQIEFSDHSATYNRAFTFSENFFVDGYAPKNKKLLTYPYNYFHVDNGVGESMALRYEFFENKTPKVRVDGVITNPVECVCKPVDYKGVTQSNTVTFFDEALSLRGYPLCSWNVDAFRAWLAQNAVPISINTVGKMAGAGVAGASAGSVGAGLVGSITSILSQGFSASIASDLHKGNFTNGGVNVAQDKMTFNFGRKSVNKQMARIIDDYFTRFGYATNAVRVPNRTSRPSFNYVKTIGCTINGSIPCDDEKLICSIYDRGVTIWHEGKTVGDYSQANSPLS